MVAGVASRTSARMRSSACGCFAAQEVDVFWRRSEIFVVDQCGRETHRACNFGGAADAGKAHDNSGDTAVLPRWVDPGDPP